MPEEFRPYLSSIVFRSKLVADTSSYRQQLRYEKIIAIGDYVLEELLRYRVYPWLAIFDCREKRIERDCPQLPHIYEKINVYNPRSTISLEAVRAIRDGIKRGGIAVVVDGEEDLLALPAIMYADESMLVIYGMPNLSAVLVRVGYYEKKIASSILEMFEPCRI